MIGDLTIRGVTREVSLEAEYSGNDKEPWGGTRTAFTVKGSLDRKDFGLIWNAALETGGVRVGDTIKLDLEIEAIMPAAPAAVS